MSVDQITKAGLRRLPHCYHYYGAGVSLGAVMWGVLIALKTEVVHVVFALFKLIPV